MSTMVERCAKAIYEKRNGAGCKPWSRLPQSHQEPYLGDARAAIEAMREPTDAMDEAGQNIANKAYLDPEELPADAHFVWQAMIAAAIRGS